MKAFVDHHIVAESDDIVEAAGYAYFPADKVRTEWLDKAAQNSRAISNVRTAFSSTMS